MKKDGIAIDESHKNRSKSEVTNEDFKSNKEKKLLKKDAKKAVVEWVSKTVENTEALWEVPISQSDSALGFGVDTKHIQSAVGVPYTIAQKYREFTNPLIEEMLKKRILIIPNESYEADELEVRRQLLNWYRNLSKEEKNRLPILENKISTWRILSDNFPKNQSLLDLNTIKDAWEYIHDDLQELGIINNDYRVMTELIYGKSKESQKARFDILAQRALNIKSDFINPSELQPFIQVEQLFASTSTIVSSESGKSNYRIASNSFMDFLSELYGNLPLKIVTVFDEHLLSRYRKYLERKIISKEISSYHANTLLSSVRRTLYRLTQVRDMEYSFFDINGFTVSRETDVKKPFTMNERIQVLDAIEKGLCQSRAALIPYKKTGWCSKKYAGDKSQYEIYAKFSDSIGLSRLQKLFKF